MKLDSGHAVTPVEGEEKARLKKTFVGYPDGLVRVSPDRWLFPGRYMDLGNDYYNFEFRKRRRPDHDLPEVWNNVDTGDRVDNEEQPGSEQPRSLTGRLWIEFDLFFPKHPPEGMEIVSSSAFLKYCPEGDLRGPFNLQLSRAIPDPRTLKTHLPFSLFLPDLLEKSKVIYVARNPKDMLVSYLHHHRLLRAQEFIGTLDEFADHFLNDDLVYGPYWLHLKEAWQRRDHPNLHFVFYEDLKADITGELKKLDAFLGTGLSGDQLANVAKHTSFGEMKSRNNLFINKDIFKHEEVVDQEVLKRDGGFFRQGKSGDWKAKLTPELIEKMDKWINEKCDFGISFK
ncbi:estrogen sulfotransferase [Penaeus vannamei]|uniref:Estrogen sulfotransferase n=1 Tax=Penaeus vannamei TaxID=6689 RepID=A0A3R7T0Z8_PENVA|nr:estrogen sulfotransferase [Penaeus vannamei]